MEGSQFLLKWNNHQPTVVSVLDSMLSCEAFVDVTLTCDGQSFAAHKVVLSACSQYFHELLLNNPCKHPIVFLKDVRGQDMAALLQFMYRGEINVQQQDLTQFLRTAESLQVKGLVDCSERSESCFPPTPYTSELPDDNVSLKSLRTLNTSIDTALRDQVSPRNTPFNIRITSSPVELDEMSPERVVGAGGKFLGNDARVFGLPSPVAARSKTNKSSLRKSEKINVLNSLKSGSNSTGTAGTSRTSPAPNDSVSTVGLDLSSTDAESDLSRRSMEITPISSHITGAATLQEVDQMSESCASSSTSLFVEDHSPEHSAENGEGQESPKKSQTNSKTASSPGKSLIKHSQLISPGRGRPRSQPLPHMFECSLCGKTFNNRRRDRFLAHLRLHTGERPFKCLICGRGFNRQDHVTVHMRLHTGGKPFQCVICKDRFAKQQELKAHPCIGPANLLGAANVSQNGTSTIDHSVTPQGLAGAIDFRTFQKAHGQLTIAPSSGDISD